MRTPQRGEIRELGHTRLSDPPGGYAEGVFRSDGRFGLVGSFYGPGGSFLVDLSDPATPQETHRLPSSSAIRNADVAFDPRDGLYYRTQEPTENDIEVAGIEIIDYGFGEATSDNPEVIATLNTGPTHNVFPHPDEPIVYATNEASGTAEDGAADGIDVCDVTDPFNPELLGTSGLTGGLHDLVVDPAREFLHAAYISAAADGFEGYAIFDISDPTTPEALGTFDYAEAPDYAGPDGEETASDVGREGFERCHYADFDPDRDIAIVGDEKARGVPGGKHVFDIGFKQGSPQDPQPIGFTTSPNAELQDERSERFDWTTHNHQVVPKGEATLLISGDYHEGLVVYDITDPTDPTPTDRFATVDDTDTDGDGEVDNNAIFDPGPPPFAWSAAYNEQRDIVLVSDFVTGVWTFDVTVNQTNTPVERFDTNDNGRIDFAEVMSAISNFNTGTPVGGKPVTFADVLGLIRTYNENER